MFKRTAVVVGVMAAGLLALAPLANASTVQVPEPTPPGVLVPLDDEPLDGDGDQFGLVNLDDLNVLDNLNVCGVTASLGLGNLLGILGTGGGDATATGGDTTCTNAFSDDD